MGQKILTANLFSQDTITAVCTPSGRGAIAVVRLSGKDAVKIADSVWAGKKLTDIDSHKATLGHIIRRDGTVLDEAMAMVMRAPRSYTGEDTVEFYLHGSPYIQREAIALLISSGARAAEGGEFSKRAVMNGRLGLTEAEGVADLISSSSKAAHRIALRQMRGAVRNRLDNLHEKLLQITALLELELDFSEEDVEFAPRTKIKTLAEDLLREIETLTRSFASGQAIKEGIQVAITGPTNAGKSSLLNALLDDDRAIVSDIHGTTRDTIEERVEIGDYLFRLIDTAGIRDTDDPIELLGIERSHKASQTADIIISLSEISSCLDCDNLELISPYNEPIESPHSDNSETEVIKVISKIDLLGIDESDFGKLQMEIKNSHPTDTGKEKDDGIIFISTVTGQGLEELKQRMISIAKTKEGEGDDLLLTNARHYTALSTAAETLRSILDNIEVLPTDQLATELHIVNDTLSSVTRSVTTPDLLQHIFEHFCIGK